MNQSIIVKDLVLIGGGHSHVHVIKMFGMNPMAGVRVTLVTRDIETPYSGMLPGYVAGYYTREECHIDLGKLCSFAGVRLLHVEASGLDISEKTIFLAEGRPPLKYDLLSIDIGICPKRLPNHLNDFALNITPVKPIDGFAVRWESILQRIISFDGSRKIRIVIVGGGGGGVELCFAIHHRISEELKARNRDSSFIEIAILTRGSEFMSSHCSDVRKIIRRLMKEKSIDFVGGADIINVEKANQESISSSDLLIAADGRKFEFDEAIWYVYNVSHS